MASRLFSSLSPGSESNLRDTLRSERVGGALLLLGTVVALLWANVFPDSYTAVSEFVVGPAALHLDLSLATWATDGLLAIFFFVVGLELKREIVAGELRHLQTAIVPVVAAVGGMLVPAAVYLVINLTADGGAPRGWAVPTATDIAFAVSVLAIVGRSLPNALRAFLLTLAVVDDLLAITIIGVVYTDEVSFLWLGAGAAVVALFAVLIRIGLGEPLPAGPARAGRVGLRARVGGARDDRGRRPGPRRAGDRAVHATSAEAARGAREVAGRAVGARLAAAVRRRRGARVRRLRRRRHAHASARCPARSPTRSRRVSRSAWWSGKPLGIFGATYLVARFTHARLAPGLGWGDVGAVGLLGGIGFTVSLLVAELAFGAGTEHEEHAIVAIIVASAVAAVLGGLALACRDRFYSRAAAEPTSG